MAGVLFYSATISFGVGVLVRSLAELPFEVVPLFLLLAFACAVLYRRKGVASGKVLLATSVCLLSLAVGCFRIDITQLNPSVFVSLEGEDVTLSGVIVREPDVRESTQHLYVREKQSGQLIMVTTDRFQSFRYGDAVYFSGVLDRPEAFETDLGRTFNYPAYLRARGVTHRVSFAEVVAVGHPGAQPIIGTLLSLKHYFMDALESVVPEPQAGLGEGLLLGVKRALGSDLEDIFRRTGIIHIVVLSGYNVMIVAEAIMRLLALVFSLRIRIAIGVVAISAFALMVGLSATVVRASIMAVLVLIARATGHTTAILRTLMFAGVCMVLLNPYLLAFDPGFQLSFLATLGLILLAPHLNQFFNFIPSFAQVREFVVATIATQIMVLPLLLFSIGQFSVVAVLVNVLVLPMVPVAMGLSFATGVVEFFLPSIAVFVGFLAYLSLTYVIVIATFFGSLSFASYIVPSFPFWIMVLSYGVLAYILYRLETRVREVDVVAELDGADEEDSYLDDWKIESFETYRSRMIQE